VSEDKLRSSQIITTFGPGAMVDFPDASVIVGGLDTWKYDAEVPAIEEPRLVEKLKKLLNKPNITLRAPPPANERGHGTHPGITGWRFPEWFIVQHRKPVLAPRGYRKRRLVHLNALDKDRYRDHEGTRNPVVPVRFVRACKKGHAGDIDWKAFVHQGPLSCARDMWMEERGTSGDLDEIWVTCDCGAERAMSQAARMDLQALGRCNGSRPWLGPGTKEGCGEPSRLLIRSASNAYFPQVLSVISIPDTHSAIDDVVRALWDDFLSEVESAADLERARRKPTVAAKLSGIDDATVLASIARVRGGSNDDRPVKAVEFEALSEAKDELGSDTPDGDFFARALPRDTWDERWMAPIERVVLVHRLREVRAQLGFTRFEAAGTDIEGELSLDVKRAPLGQDVTWLPAIANRGEGVFLLFKEDAVRDWLKKAKVNLRGQELDAGFKKWKDEHEGSSWDFPGLPYYLLHSFSHLLLTAMALECGYPASSLRERVYAAPGRYGILIYTGSTDAEGTLGGLVLAGRDMARHVQRALDMAALCSNDPVCAHHSPARPDHQPLHGAACHGCLLIAETSCEQRNDFLDRSVVVRTVEHLGCEFFPPVP
jgi:hypothetical protein